MLMVPDGTPASVRTLVWFREIVVVAARPSSTLTWYKDIAPLAGNGI
jgi:hypothetical protein